MRNLSSLYNRQTDTVDLLIDVERIDVGHAADVINYRHDALLQILVLYIILAAYPAQELLGVEAGWVYGSLDENLHQSCHDLITRKFYVEYRLALVNLGVGGLLTFLVCLFLALGNVVNETALESSGKDFLFVTGVQTCALPISGLGASALSGRVGQNLRKFSKV